MFVLCRRSKDNCKCLSVFWTLSVSQGCLCALLPQVGHFWHTVLGLSPRGLPLVSTTYGLGPSLTGIFYGWRGRRMKMNWSEMRKKYSKETLLSGYRGLWVTSCKCRQQKATLCWGRCVNKAEVWDVVCEGKVTVSALMICYSKADIS